MILLVFITEQSTWLDKINLYAFYRLYAFR